MDSVTSQFDAVLKSAKIKIVKFDPSKPRPVSLNSGSAITVDTFSKKLRDTAFDMLLKYPEVAKVSNDTEAFEELILNYATEKRSLVKGATEIEVPDNYPDLQLNLDQSHEGRDLRFFMTTKEELVSEVTGNVWLRVMGMKDDEALSRSRKVVPTYLPRDPRGTSEILTRRNEKITVFNKYVPPDWMSYKKPLPDRLPALFEKLVNHLFPLKIERRYFYAWLHASLFDRAFVYLILCGPGGTGKNRLKLVLRALHGIDNTVDGKRSTLIERFNSQLADATLAWFDELSYDMETENVMKEIQNDSISIERKGLDATRSTKIYSSLVISNNKPRDNYIAFDSRKFVPLQITPHRLDSVMSAKELDAITHKVQNWKHPDYDVAFIAQIGRWIEKHGASEQWPQLEYKGPMFYKLAHTSMSRWQKKAASLLLNPKMLNSSRIVFDAKFGYLWSTVAESSMKKNGDRSQQFPDPTTVRHFFEIFVDANGDKAFKTRGIPDDIMGDFYVKLENPKVRILTEAEVTESMGEEDDEEEILDL